MVGAVGTVAPAGVDGVVPAWLEPPPPPHPPNIGSRKMRIVEEKNFDAVFIK
jgi:hypothetical protein